MAHRRTRYRDIIAIGASAGGAHALSELAGGLPAELPAAVLVTQHISPRSPRVLAEILSRAGNLPATFAINGEPIERGHIYVAPPDHHLLIGQDRLLVTRGPRENGHRPAVDPLFRSAARQYSQRVVAVVLSGTLDDGSAGLVAVKARGGIAIAQDPEDALYSAMPRNAIERDHPDHVVPISELAELLCTLVQQRLRPLATNGRDTEQPIPDSAEPQGEDSSPIPVSCPECGGPLFGGREGSMTTFRCLVGHRFSPASLDQEQARNLEASLWSAARGLHERAELVRRLAREHGSGSVSTLYLDRARAFEEQAEAVVAAVQRLGSESEQYTEANT